MRTAFPVRHGRRFCRHAFFSKTGGSRLRTRTAFHEFDEVILDVALDLAQLQHQLIGDTQHLGHARLVGARHGQGAVRLGAERRVRQRLFEQRERAGGVGGAHAQRVAAFGLHLIGPSSRAPWCRSR